MQELLQELPVPVHLVCTRQRGPQQKHLKLSPAPGTPAPIFGDANASTGHQKPESQRTISLLLGHRERRGLNSDTLVINT